MARKAQKRSEAAPVVKAAEAPKEKPKDIGWDLVVEHARAHHHKLKIWSSVLAFCFLFVVGSLAYVLSKAPEYPPEVKLVPDSTQTPVLLTGPTLSIAWLLENATIRNGDLVYATGYLWTKQDTAQNKYTYFLADDFGNTVLLSGLQSSDLRLFSANGKDTYTIRSIARKVQGSFMLEVKDVESTK